MNKPLKGVIPIPHIYIRGNILEKGNIPGVAGDKAVWAKDLNLPKQGEYMFYAGCGYQFMRYAEAMMRAAASMEKVGIGREKGIGISKVFGKIGMDLPSITAKVAAAGKEDVYTRVLVGAASILQKLGISIGYMYEDEPCCGSPLYYSGFLDDYVENAKKNFQVFKSLGIQRLIGLIPACTASLRDYYPKYVEGYDLKVYHFIEIVAQRLRETKVKPRLREKISVAYHDPCQLSRYLQIIDAPREVMASIEGLELREPDPEQCRRWATCCGGGGLEAGSPELCERLGLRRTEELLKTGANVIVTLCPACVMQLRRSAQKMKADVKVMDLVEILDEALE
jgi:Fe-S oxidoreductase